MTKNNATIEDKGHVAIPPTVRGCGAAGVVLCFCLFIILWGAWVRISHSGDGCGQNWPDCQGWYLIEAGADQKTWTEWFHRATSGVFGVMVLLLTIFNFVTFPRSHPARKAVLWALFFTVTEALIGARLVLSGLTAGNTSLARALTMNLHLLNSLLLTASLFICWRLSLGKRFDFALLFKQKGLGIFVLGFFVLAGFGALSSLSASLFPSSSLWEGLALDFNKESHWLIRLRFLHPLLAILFGGGFLYYMVKRGASSVTRMLILCLCLTLLSGLMNLLLLSPVILKLTHLLIVYLLAMSFILTLETSSS